MKIWIFRRFPPWYWGFITGFFLLMALFPDILQLMAVDGATPNPIYHGNKSDPKVAIGCNVFWGEEYLPEMLDILDQNKIKITFFVGGSWAKRHPEMVKLIAQRGHEIGNHSYSHPHPNTLSKEQNKDQILRAEELIRDYTGVRTSLYAPPYGEFNVTVLQAASELNYTTILWSIDTIDWKRPSKDIIVSRVEKKLHNGAIILIHPTKPTTDALPELIALIQSRGLSVNPVSALLH
ncbi:MAG: polysaccharide deacetylase family protein [Negativicutes bacterium]|nr:polysaccharide deacetylase family protein [Negativicutes bacterium]